MSSLLALPGAVLDASRTYADMALGTFILPFRPLRRLIPIPPAPALADSQIRHSDPGGDLALVVGGTAGIGKEIVYQLAIRGADVILACRNVSKGEEVKTSLLFRAAKQPGIRVNLRITVMQLDTSDLGSVRSFARDLDAKLGKDRTIRLLMLNAGIFTVPQGKPDFDEQGNHVVYLTNFLGHFLLTYLLRPHLTQHSRVISTSSVGGTFAVHGSAIAAKSEPNVREPGFHVQSAVRYTQHVPTKFVRDLLEGKSGPYVLTKGQQILFMRALAEHYERLVRGGPDGKKSNSSTAGSADDAGGYGTPFFASYHPGLVQTEIFAPGGVRRSWRDGAYFERGLESLIGLSGLNAEEGAATPLYLALADRKQLEAPPAAGAAKGKTDNGKFWTRNAKYAAPQLKLPSETVARWWKRWCADADVDWTL